MNDRQIGAVFMSVLLPAIQADPELATVKVARSYQQTQQGASTEPYVYFSKISDRRYGHPARKDTYNTLDAEFDHSELQYYESTYQLSAWVPQLPVNATALTESDVLNKVAGIIQSDAILAAFLTAGLGILRVTDVRNPYITDDRDQFEAVPSFDVVFTHTRSVVATVPVVVTYDAVITRV